MINALVREFRNYYGPTMNAFDAAEKNGRAANLQKELEDLFTRENKSHTPEHDFHTGNLFTCDGGRLMTAGFSKES